MLSVEAADVEGGWHALFAPGADTGKKDEGRRTKDEGVAPAEPVRRLIEGAHTIVTFASSGSDAWADNVKHLAPAAQFIPLTTAVDGDEHVCDGLVGQLGQWPVIREGMRQMLGLVRKRGIGNARRDGGTLLIHPGGGSEKKCWPLERFGEVIRRLRERGESVRVLVGEVELEKWPGRQMDMLREMADVRQPGTLLDLLAELSGARLLIANDSGPGHLAAIIGVPVLSLRAGANEKRWIPVGPSVRAVRAATIEAIDVEQVWRAVVSV